MPSETCTAMREVMRKESTWGKAVRKRKLRSLRRLHICTQVLEKKHTWYKYTILGRRGGGGVPKWRNPIFRPHVADFHPATPLACSDSVHTMSESQSTHQLLSSLRAAHNPYSQANINKSLAVFLASNNLPVPSALKHPSQSNKWWLYREHENNFEVCSCHLVFNFLLTSDNRTTLFKLTILRLMCLYLRLMVHLVTRAQHLWVHINNLRPHQKVAIQVQGHVMMILY